MRNPTRALLVMHTDPTFLARARAVPGREFAFRHVSDWPSLAEEVRSAPPAIVVVDPYHEAGANGPCQQLRTFLRDFPSTPVLAALDIQPERGDDLRVLGEWGVCGIIALGHDDTVAALQERFRAARGRPLKTLIGQVLPDEISAPARSILDVAAEVVSVGGGADALAKRLYCSKRTLVRWCERTRLPPPRRLMAWMRILLASELLDDPGRTILSVAQSCAYSSDAGLRRVMQAFVGIAPTELRERGAFATTSKQFRQVLERRGAGQ